MLRLTETRGSRSCPASLHAARKALICSVCWTWSGSPVSSNLSVERLHVHAQLRGPHRGRVDRRRPTRSGRAGPRNAAPGAAGRAGWETSAAGWARRSPRPTAAPGRPCACRRAMSPSSSPSRRHVAEVAEAVDHLLRRAAADAQLQPAAGDDVGRARVLDHVERVLVAHVDHGRADLDPAGAGADGREQRERRGQLLREVVDAEVGAVRAELLGRHRQLDRLQQRVRRGPHLRVRRRRPMAEGQEPNALHVSDSIGAGRTGWTVDSAA